jgi:hypothetical protein
LSRSLKLPAFVFSPRVCNSVSDQPLPEEFQNRYDQLRGLRNRLIHSVGRAPVQDPDLDRTILKSFKYLVRQVSDWCSGAAAYFGWMRDAKRENTRCGL